MRPTLAKIATLMRSSLPSTVTSVVVGKNDSPLISDLPQVQIFPESTSVELSGTLRDIQTRVVNIRVIDSVKKHLNQSSSNIFTVSSMLSVCDFVEKKDSTNAFSTTSVLGILRRNPDISGEQLYQDNISVDYSSLGQLGFPNAVASLKVQLQSRDLTE